MKGDRTQIQKEINKTIPRKIYDPGHFSSDRLKKTFKTRLKKIQQIYEETVEEKIIRRKRLLKKQSFPKYFAECYRRLPFVIPKMPNEVSENEVEMKEESDKRLNNSDNDQSKQPFPKETTTYQKKEEPKPESFPTVFYKKI